MPGYLKMLFPMLLKCQKNSIFLIGWWSIMSLLTGTEMLDSGSSQSMKNCYIDTLTHKFGAKEIPGFNLGELDDCVPTARMSIPNMSTMKKSVRILLINNIF
jgi:hypothetical protein